MNKRIHFLTSTLPILLLSSLLLSGCGSAADTGTNADTTGAADIVISSMTITEERKNPVDFSDPCAGSKDQPPRSSLKPAASHGIVGGVFRISLRTIQIWLDFTFLGEFCIRIWSGFLAALGLSFFSLICSLLIGILSAAGQSSPVFFIRFFCRIYVKFIRGTPLIIQIYLFFYIVGTAWGVNNRFVAGGLILSIFEGACDKAAFLCEGSLMEYGGSAQLSAHPETEQLKRFLGKLLEWNI